MNSHWTPPTSPQYFQRVTFFLGAPKYGPVHNNHSIKPIIRPRKFILYTPPSTDFSPPSISQALLLNPSTTTLGDKNDTIQSKTMTSRNDKSTENPGPVPLPPASNRRASFSQNPSFSTLFGTTRGSPPRAAPDPSLSRRFSWSYPPPKESSSAIDDSDEMVTSPTDDRRASEVGLGRRLSTATSSIREALGFKADEPTSPRAMKAVIAPLICVSTLPDCVSRIHFNHQGNRALILQICPPPVPLPLLPKVCTFRAKSDSNTYRWRFPRSRSNRPTIFYATPTSEFRQDTKRRSRSSR